LKREHLINFKVAPESPQKEFSGPKYLESGLTDNKEYSLVLDLDETLVHFAAKEKKFKIRPGCIQFLKDMSKLFEIIIFTAAQQDYADFILNHIDKNEKKLIDHRLYRHHCDLDNGVYVKDLSRLGRDLKKTIIIDNIRDNFERQKNNGIEILTWISDPEDKELYKLGGFLTNIVDNKIKDVRD
jgi:CTD small phosphatase-like protein 2